MPRKIKTNHKNKLIKIIKTIENIILKQGIPMYIEKWIKPKIPEEFKTYDEFLIFLQKFVNSYHKHAFIQSKYQYEKYQKPQQETDIIQNNNRKTPEFD